MTTYMCVLLEEGIMVFFRPDAEVLFNDIPVEDISVVAEPLLSTVDGCETTLNIVVKTSTDLTFQSRLLLPINVMEHMLKSGTSIYLYADLFNDYVAHYVSAVTIDRDELLLAKGSRKTLLEQLEKEQAAKLPEHFYDEEEPETEPVPEEIPEPVVEEEISEDERIRRLFATTRKPIKIASF